ncbi:hypothetical protein K0M31_020243 [Melipona bicolor]|uniref:Uncharacterized protein n=1 Tax=Melipona bicolor TaxID=60889 RepID=A0AA40G188_9HYME|nr:hypothetical protein K0M31_020243 [Melipona bicolor]
MTASVGLVVVAANRRESAGRTAAPRREAHRALRGYAGACVRRTLCRVPCPRNLDTASPPTTPEGCASAAAIPPPHWSTRSTSTRSRDLAAARWHAAARERAADRTTKAE